MFAEKIVTLFSNDALKRFTILEAYAELRKVRISPRCEIIVL